MTTSRHTMQKLVLKLLVCACIGSLCSCAQPAQPEEETLYVSILPLKSIVGGIVGDDAFERQNGACARSANRGRYGQRIG